MLIKPLSPDGHLILYNLWQELLLALVLYLLLYCLNYFNMICDIFFLYNYLDYI